MGKLRATGVWLILSAAALKLGEATGACQVIGTTPNGGANVVCEGQDTIGVVTGAKNDAISVTATGSIAKSTHQTVPSNAGANAIAIDAGKGRDEILNQGTVDVQADATAQAAGTHASSAMAEAKGFRGGTGSDKIHNEQTLSASATATATSPALSLNLSGSQTGREFTRSSATATGMEGGAGENDIANLNRLSVSAVADGSAPFVRSVTTGSSRSLLGVESTAEANGMSGQGSIANLAQGQLNVSATATAKTAAAQATVSGSSRADVSSSAYATARGLLGSASEDSLNSEGAVIVGSTAIADGGIDLITSAPHVRINAAITAMADSVGFNGGAGSDSLSNGSDLAVNASATATATNTGASFWAPGVTDADANAIARAAALSGASGNDSVVNTGTIRSTVSAGTVSDLFIESFVARAKELEAGKAAKATAAFSGLDGGAGGDQLINNGTISATLQATASASYTMPTAGGLGMFYSPLTATAQCTGLEGDSGNDSLVNGGNILLQTGATASTSNKSVSGLQMDIYQEGQTAISALNVTTGLSGGSGNDSGVNRGTVTVTATTDASSTSLGFEAIGSTRSSASVTASTAASGMVGDSGNDRLSNESGGQLHVDATATTNSTGFDYAMKGLPTEPFSWLGISSLDGKTTAHAQGWGIDGGSGIDTLANGGTLTVNVNASATSTNVAVEFKPPLGTKSAPAALTAIPATHKDAVATDSPAPTAVPATPSQTTGTALADATTVSTAQAFGLTGGNGNDLLTNNGKLEAIASSDTTSSGISASIDISLDKGVDAIAADSAAPAVVPAAPSQTTDAALADAATVSTDQAFGLTGGGGNDRLTNDGSLTANAIGKATSTGISTSISYGKGGVESSLLPGATMVDASTYAETTAVGLDGGAGNDSVSQTNTLTVESNATASSTSVGVEFKAQSEKGASWGGTKTDASSVAKASAFGLMGDVGNDTLDISGTHKSTVNATATAKAASVGLTVEGSGEGLAAGITYADGSVRANALAVGVDGGGGIDTVTQNAALEVNSTAETANTTVSVSVAAVKTFAAKPPKGVRGTGVALSAALADTSSEATAEATGIKTGSGNDRITASSSLTTTATAINTNNSIAASLGYTQTGLTAGVAAADATVTAGATAVGVDAGVGNDAVNLLGTATTTATATVKAVTVAANAGAAVNGVAAGAALVKGTTTVQAQAIGLEGGEGNDTVINGGTNTVAAHAAATVTKVGVSLEYTSVGLAAGASIMEGQSTVEASATGINGGGGRDTLRNFGRTNTSATADSTSTEVSVAGNLALKGIAAGASLVKADNSAIAQAIGLDGSREQITLLNQGTLATNATTTATTTSVAVNVSLSGTGLSGGAAVASAKTTGTGAVNGMIGSSQDDRLENQTGGKIEGTASTTAKTNAVSVNVATLSFGKADASTTANARYTGMEGGSGKDTLISLGNMDIHSSASGGATSASGGLFNYGIADTYVESIALTRAMNGGEGNDSLTNGGALTATSDATATGLAVTASLAGYGKVKGDTSAFAFLAGLDGGNGNNTLTNAESGALNLTATATGVARTYDVTLGGGSEAKAGTDATASTFGLLSGAGVDTLSNDGSINLLATSLVNASSVNLKLIGVTIGDASSTSSATAIGMDGGDGLNTLTNGSKGSITASADAGATATSVAVEIGVDAITASSLALARATGLQGGTGDDMVTNLGRLTAAAKSRSTTVSGSFSLASFSANDAAPGAIAVGINSGGGNDTIVNAGTLIAGGIGTDPMAYAEVGSASFHIVEFNTSQFAANSEAAAILGGLGNDVIRNRGSITAGSTGWMSKGQAIGFTGSFLGMASVGSHATSNAFGMDGGSGNNVLVNESGGNVTVYGTANGYTRGAADTSFGKNAAFANATATATATAMTGGLDADTLENLGTLISTAKGWADAYADANVIGGSPTAESTATVTATALGLLGGAGTNLLTNGGSITVSADAASTPISYADSTFGRTNSNATSIATASAIGLVGGSGRDTITNSSGANLEVSATTRTLADDGHYLMASLDETARITAGNSNTPISAKATAMSAGTGGGSLTNAGTVRVDAIAKPMGYANTSSYQYSTSSVANIYGLAVAKGMEAADLQDSIGNSGTMTVAAWSHVVPTTDAWSLYSATTNAVGNSNAIASGIEGRGVIGNTTGAKLTVKARATGYADSDSLAELSNANMTLAATATGINANLTCASTCAGSRDQIQNQGELAVTARAGEGDDGKEQTSAFANSQVSTNNATSTAKGAATVTATGIQLGSGVASGAANSGLMDVTASEHMNLSADAYSGLYNPNPNAQATGSAAATGINGMDGAYQMVNEAAGVMNVSASANAGAKGNGITGAWRSASGTSSATTASEASGMASGTGRSELTNRGDIKVVSNSSAKAEATADAGLDSYGTANSTATATASAYGLHSGNGGPIIINAKSVDVKAVATSYAYAYADAEEFWGEHEISITTATSQALAWGIKAGDGDNVIVNQGDLKVAAQTTATAISATEDNRERYMTLNHSEAAVGIETGAGDDNVTNLGTLSANQTYNGTGTSGIAITTGAGNDQVTLGASSVTTGRILLGEGDDALLIHGAAATPAAAVNGDIDAGAGTDSLTLDGAGSLSLPVTGFENLAKQGAGTFTLNALPTLKQLDVNQGVLRVESGYAMANDSVFRTVVYADGSSGHLSVKGTAALDGSLSVAKSKGLYVKGLTWDIITANSVQGVFDKVELPASTKLVRFGLTQSADHVQVETRALDFTSAAANPVQSAVAGYLDRLRFSASGELRSVLARVQHLNTRSEFADAFNSLSQRSHEQTTAITLIAAQQQFNPIQYRLAGLRASHGATQPQSIRQPYSGAMSLASLFRDSEQRADGNGLWMTGLWQEGDQQDRAGLPGYDFTITSGTAGYDHSFDNNLTLGAAISKSTTYVDQHSTGHGSIDSYSGMLYGSYASGPGYLEGAVAYGRNDHHNRRFLSIGDIHRSAASQHNTESFSAYLGVGYLFPRGSWSVGPTAALRYVHLDEEGYTERGAGTVNLKIKGRNVDSLISELGLRATATLETNWGVVVPEVSAGIRYDFDIGDRITTASFEGAPGTSFSLKGQNSDRFGAILGVGLTANTNSGVSMSLQYRGDYRDKFQSHGLFGLVRVEF